MTSHERLDTDIVIIGAGPAGLSAAIRLKQLAKQHQKELSVIVLEKGAEIGAHILSGAVLEPRALDELLPNWRDEQVNWKTPASEDAFVFLTAKHALTLPTPRQMNNQGNFIVRLGFMCKWLAEKAEQLGVEIFPGFAAVDIIEDEAGRAIGVITGDMGIDKHNQPTSQFTPGIAIHAQQIILAEGCRGSLTKKLEPLFSLRDKNNPQSYGIGIKELWEINPQHSQPGKVLHTVGWPLDQKTYGGSFVYHLDNNLVSLGMVVGLDYENPYLNPYEEMQRFKTHPYIAKILKDGKRIQYGARALNEGGWQAIPKLTFPGGVLIGCAAGFMNVPKIKGTHTAMKSAMLAAEAIFDNIIGENAPEVVEYENRLKQSWVAQELYQVRNIRPAFHYGLLPGLTYAAIDTYLLNGKAPWTFKFTPDYSCLKPAARCKAIEYPKADNVLTFDKLTNLHYSNVYHSDNEPVHLILKNPGDAININLKIYDAPETRYCPANVYEIVKDDQGNPRLQINAQNCIHCKTCDIKDPTQNITWVPPQGGEGPNYSGM
jgi:electron-transferring-flavoprotein dehydrogenase